MADLPAPVDPKTPARFGVVPTTIEEAWRVAVIMAKSGIVPDAMKEKPEAVFVAMQLGAELGLSPTNAVQTIAVINGRAAIFGDGLLAVIKQSPVFVAIDEWLEVAGKRVEALTDDALKDPATVAVCCLWRRGVEDPLVRRFSIGDARRARLLEKPGPWKEYPSRMLQMRARSFAARDLFPDVLKGIVAAEEAGDVTPPPLAQVRRLSETPPPDLEPVADLEGEI